MAEQVKAVLAGATTDNPISAALQLLQFEKSDNPVEQALGQVLAELAAIKAAVLPVVDTSETQKARLDRALELLVGRSGFIGPRVVGGGLLSRFGRIVEGPEGDAMLCANCGQPVTLEAVTLRSSDDRPIHPPGQCLPRPDAEGGRTSAAP